MATIIGNNMMRAELCPATCTHTHIMHYTARGRDLLSWSVYKMSVALCWEWCVHGLEAGLINEGRSLLTTDERHDLDSRQHPAGDDLNSVIRQYIHQNPPPQSLRCPDHTYHTLHLINRYPHHVASWISLYITPWIDLLATSRATIHPITQILWAHIIYHNAML